MGRSSRSGQGPTSRFSVRSESFTHSPAVFEYCRNSEPLKPLLRRKGLRVPQRPTPHPAAEQLGRGRGGRAAHAHAARLGRGARASTPLARCVPLTCERPARSREPVHLSWPRWALGSGPGGFRLAGAAAASARSCPCSVSARLPLAGVTEAGHVVGSGRISYVVTSAN